MNTRAKSVSQRAAAWGTERVASFPVYRNQDLGFNSHAGTENEYFRENLLWLDVSWVTLGDS